MEEDGMLDNGIIPIRNGCLPGQVKLPKRYEAACQTEVTTRIPTRHRKISFAQINGNTMNDRIGDLNQAMLWIKQELIMLRQHDILLKRQFFNIQDTIKSFNKPADDNDPQTINHVDKNHNFKPVVHMLLRSSSSITAINEDDYGDSENDDMDFRPRTGSTTTSRDLAALARRRGSKELI